MNAPKRSDYRSESEYQEAKRRYERNQSSSSSSSYQDYNTPYSYSGEDSCPSDSSSSYSDSSSCGGGD